MNFASTRFTAALRGDSKVSQMSSRPLPSLGDNGLPSSVLQSRRLLPAPLSSSGGTSSSSDKGLSVPLRRPRAGLTNIACESCRKRKAKVLAELHIPMLLLRVRQVRPANSSSIPRSAVADVQTAGVASKEESNAITRLQVKIGMSRSASMIRSKKKPIPTNNCITS
jgi:hypothetical protein